MPFVPNPETVEDSAIVQPRTLGYDLRTVSFLGGNDIAVERLAGTVRTTLSRQQVSVDVIPGGGVRLTIIDARAIDIGDSLIATRSSAAADPAVLPASGAAPAQSVRASLSRLFASVQELTLRPAGEGGTGQPGAISRPEVVSLITDAIAGITPAFTEALRTRLLAARTEAEVQAAIDTALAGIGTDIRRVVDGAFVVALIDAQEGNTDWRTPGAVDVSVDPNQMTGDGRTATPISIVQGGIAAGLLAAGAVATGNLDNEAVTIDKLSAVLQGNWRNMLRSVREISVTGATATATRVDGTEFTFPVGSGMGGGGRSVLDLGPID